MFSGGGNTANEAKTNMLEQIDYFGKSEPPFRQSEPPVEVGWICM